MSESEDYDPPGGESIRPKSDESEEADGPMDAVADTSPPMEGFQTGASLDLEGSPSEESPDSDPDLELGVLVTRPNTFEELDLASDSSESVEDVDARGWDAGAQAGDAQDGAPDPTFLGGEARSEPALEPRSTIEEPVRTAQRSGLQELRRRKNRRLVGRLLMTAAATVLIVGTVGLVAAYFGVVDVDGITRLDRSRFVVAPPVALPGPQPETPVMSYALLVDTWRGAETPLAWAAALRERMPDLLPFVTALSIDGELQYALMVGPAYGAREANALKVPLVTAFARLNPDPASWIVAEAPYAFFFGEYGTLAEANGRVRDLVGRAVPAYVLQVRYPNGASALRVYGGAFTDGGQASAMGRLLIENGLTEIPLTERRGRLPR